MCPPNWPPSGPSTAPNTEADRARDAYERDDGLQRRTGEVYSGLAAADWCGRWLVAGPDIDAPLTSLGTSR